jgi:hypothetical protein
MQLVLLLKPVSFRGTVLVEHLKVDLFVFYGGAPDVEVGIAECQCRLRHIALWNVFDLSLI